MPTSPVSTNPSVQSSSLDQLIVALDRIVAERGIALNSLIDGLLNAVHFVDEGVIYNAASSPSLLEVPEGVGFLLINTAGGNYTFWGARSPAFSGRLIHIVNDNFIGGTLTLNHNDGTVNVEDRFWNVSGAAVVLAARGSATYTWCTNGTLFGNGIWRQIS